MFAFTPLKILLLVLLIGVVWYGAKILKRRDEIAEELRAKMGRKRAEPPPGSQAGSQSQAQAIDDLTACPRCGTYVVPRQAKRCERADCPYPG